MIKKNKDGIHWIEYPLFEELPSITVITFLRKGGTSQGNFSSLNFSEEAGDKKEHVQANYARTCALLNTPSLTICHQTHGKKVVEITPKTKKQVPSCDALTTNYPEISLTIRHADCQAAIFYDPIKKALATIHCGWRGQVQNIYAETITFMQRRYGSYPSNLFVAISPSLGPENAQFIHYKKELPPEFWEFQCKPLYFNFWEIARKQLTDCGVLPNHIECAAVDTYAHPEEYFSYRRDRETGRHATVAFLTTG